MEKHQARLLFEQKRRLKADAAIEHFACFSSGGLPAFLSFS
jgi:hypothetical protein